MSVRYLFPKSRLAKLLREPGGQKVSESVAKGHENLAAMRQTCLDEIDRAMKRIEASFDIYQHSGDLDALDELYAAGSEAIGAGSLEEFVAIDAALISLCELLDGLKSSGAKDIESVAVHVRSLRLLMQLCLAGRTDGAEEILAGLKQVSDRHALPER